MRATALYLLLALFLLDSAPAAATPLPPAAAPGPCKTADPALTDDLGAAFAYDLTSAPILHFVSVLATLPVREQKHVFDAAVAAASTPRERAASAVIEGSCPDLDAIDGASRVAILVENMWELAEPDLTSEKRIAQFSVAVGNAAAALSANSRLTPEQRIDALAPFAAVLASAAPSPPPSESGACAQPNVNASVVDPVQPYYPVVQQKPTVGTVLVKVTLSDAGATQSVSLYHETLKGPASADLVRVSILAAAATKYIAEIKDCRPIGGGYIFRSDYGISAAPLPASPVASPGPCAPADPALTSDLQAVFAYDLKSRPIQRFVAAIATLPVREQRRVFDAAVSAASSPRGLALQAAIAASCTDLDAIDGAARAAIFVENTWDLDEAEAADEQRLGRFSAAIGNAALALSANSRLTPELRNDALAPFAALLARADPPPTPSASGDCSQPNTEAHIIKVFQPTYPPVAELTATSGVVHTTVTLSDAGELRSVSLLRDTLKGPSSGDLIRATILAAAGTNYAPATAECRTVASVYTFTAEFR